MNTRFKVLFASYNTLQDLCDFIHVLNIFEIVSKCQKKSQINEYSDCDCDVMRREMIVYMTSISRIHPTLKRTLRDYRFVVDSSQATLAGVE